VSAAAELRTARLGLHRLSGNDAALMLAIWNDPDFVRHVGDRGIRTLDEARAALRDGALRHWREHGYGPYRVSAAGSGEALGICGLFKRDNLDDPDIGYALLRAYRGQGYALEAALAVRDHARDRLRLPRLAAIVAPGHARSVRLLQKLGMRAAGRVRMPGEEQDLLLYAMRLGQGNRS